MWRPENWEEIVEGLITRRGGIFNQDILVIIEDDRRLCEAVADAMLEALRKGAIIEVYENAEGLDAMTFALPKGLKRPVEGKLIFIPDEEVR